MSTPTADPGTARRSPARRALRMAAMAALLGLVVAWLVLLRPAMLGGPATYVVVSGDSMAPTLSGGDLVVAKRRPAYAPGDVVVFATPEGPLVIHRIVGGSAAEGFVLRGDNKDDNDLWRPVPEEILGEAWLHVPAAGRVLAGARAPRTLGAVAAALVFLALIQPSAATSRRRGNAAGPPPRAGVPRVQAAEAHRVLPPRFAQVPLAPSVAQTPRTGFAQVPPAPSGAQSPRTPRFVQVPPAPPFAQVPCTSRSWAGSSSRRAPQTCSPGVTRPRS